jgi:hypothetical protein
VDGGITSFAFGAVLSCGLLMGCSASNDYSGDGQMIDHGPFAATDRYVLDLGPIDLTRQGKRSYRLGNLPSENFVCGIEVSAPTSSHVQWDKRQIDASISMDIVGNGGEVLMHIAGPLPDWTWSMDVTGATSAFLYVRGSPGSFFTPTKGSSYRLNVSVDQPDAAHPEIKATLRLKSGGWK